MLCECRKTFNSDFLTRGSALEPAGGSTLEPAGALTLDPRYVFALRAHHVAQNSDPASASARSPELNQNLLHHRKKV